MNTKQKALRAAIDALQLEPVDALTDEHVDQLFDGQQEREAEDLINGLESAGYFVGDLRDAWVALHFGQQRGGR